MIDVGAPLADALRGYTMDKSQEFIDQTPVGAIIHRGNLGVTIRAYFRCEVVLGDDGRKWLKPFALVGEWGSHEFPRYKKNGGVLRSHVFERIDRGELFEFEPSTTYEGAKALGILRYDHDPRDQAPLKMEPWGDVDAEFIRLSQLRERAVKVLKSKKLTTADELRAAFKQALSDLEGEVR